MATGAEPAAGAVRNRKRTRVAAGSAYQYEEICSLGAGAFGAVVKAHHCDTGRIVAIKRATAAGEGPAELMREARLLELASADNPFVVGFTGLVREPETQDLRLVMECVGPSLHDLLQQRPRRSPPLPEAAVRAAMWQLLTGARATHERRIIHRDIKPQNVLVGGDAGCAVLKICDFGLAVSVADEAPPYEQAGTPCYKAPEMLLDKPDYDARVDAWSLGCVMAELVHTGKPLFKGGANDDGQLCAIFDVLGVPDDGTWPWFSSTPFGAEVLPKLRVQRRNVLRELFPEKLLSEEGFEVLNGLLTCNPEKRLTTAAALKLPWFAKVDALELPQKKEVAAALPKPKRRKGLVCV